MKNLILPLLLIFLPAALLFFINRYSSKQKRISNCLKIILGIIFIAIGLFASCHAITMSIEGISEKGISCMTDVVFFIPVALIIYLLGVPYLLFSRRNRDSKFAR